MRPWRMYNGRKIDVRWHGGWLAADGTYLPVEYAAGVTHESIAGEHMVFGSGSISTMPPMAQAFYLHCWMRIAYFEPSSFCVQLSGTFVTETSGSERRTDRSRRDTLLRFVRDYKRFDSYYINDVRYDRFWEFARAIRHNEVTPAEASLYEREEFRKRNRADQLEIQLARLARRQGFIDVFREGPRDQADPPDESPE